jgi:hypothetical protein
MRGFIVTESVEGPLQYGLSHHQVLALRSHRSGKHPAPNQSAVVQMLAVWPAQLIPRNEIAVLAIDRKARKPLCRRRFCNLPTVRLK